MKNHVKSATTRQGEEFAVASKCGDSYLDSAIGVALNEPSVSRSGSTHSIAEIYPPNPFDGTGFDPTRNCGQLEAELRRSLEHQDFRVYYQPIVYLDTGRIAGFEALVRWQHPTRGLLSPADFLQVAEDTGLIVPIGQWVLREACQQMHRWHLKFSDNPLLYLSVNISSQQFEQTNLVEQIGHILHETGLTPASLKLEITETLVMRNSESARNILLQLRALNVKLAIDDFGTGYSSLSYLQTFPVHTLKIDHSFIARLQDAKESLEIVRAVVTLAHNLGLDVVAEGVETPIHLAMLKILKCEFGQGYFYSRPVITERAEELIAKELQAQPAMPGAVLEEEAGFVLNASKPPVGQCAPEASLANLNESTNLVSSLRTHLDNRDDEALRKMMNLSSDPAAQWSEENTNSIPKHGTLDQELREEFEIYIEDLKQVAIKQFDQELYSACLPTFQFLCELEPDNHTLRDYLELSRQLCEEATAVQTSATHLPVPGESLAPVPESNASPTKRDNGEATASMEQENTQESLQIDRSFASHVLTCSRLDGNVSTPVPESDSTSISRNKRVLALLVVVLTIAVGVIIDFWVNGQQHSAGSSAIEINQPKVIQSELSQLKAMAKSFYDKGDLQEASRSCDAILLKEPHNSFALDLKESIRRAAPANPHAVPKTGSLQTGKPTSGPSKPTVRQLSSENLTYTVIHDHLIGSCRGTLRFTGHSISYVPSGDNRHAFAFKLTDIVGTERGDTLKIKFKQDSYRFKTRFDKAKNRSTVATIDQQLARARVDNGLGRTETASTRIQKTP